MGRDREAVVHEVGVPTAERPNQSLSGREPLPRCGRLHVFVECSAMCDCETTWTGSRAWQAPPNDAWACQSSDVTAISAQQGCSLGICWSILSSGDRIWETPRP